MALSTRPSPRLRHPVVLALALLAAAALGVLAAGALPDIGLEDGPGALGEGAAHARAGARALRLAGVIALVGGSLVAAWIVTPESVDVEARNHALRIAISGAVAWGAGAALELVAVWATISSSIGLDSRVLSALLSARVGSTLALQILLSAIAAALLVVLAPVGASAEIVGLVAGIVGVAAAVYGGHGALDAGHQLAGAAITLHVVAASLWAGGLGATLATLSRLEQPHAALKRYGSIAIVCAVIVAMTGVTAGALLNDPSRLTESAYGWLLMAKAGVLAVIITLAWRARVRLAKRDWAQVSVVRTAFIEMCFLGVAVGVAAVLSQTAPLPLEIAVAVDPLLTAPAPATLTAIVLDPWGLTTAVALAIAYGAGVLALRRRGISWPLRRTAAFTGGIVVLLLVTCTGLGAYASILMSAHMAQHMAINMIAPILLVMGAPLTLALRTLPPKPRATVLSAPRSLAGRIVLHPAVVTTIFTASLFLVYFTPLFPALMADHAGHGLMQTHFLISGFVFFWMLLGVDPDPNRPSAPARIPHIGAAMIAHTGFAVVLVFGSSVIGLEWFSLQTPLWTVSRLDDQALAGGIAWGVGEFIMVAVLIVVLVRWFGATERVDAARLRQRHRGRPQPGTPAVDGDRPAPTTEAPDGTGP